MTIGTAEQYEHLITPAQVIDKIVLRQGKCIEDRFRQGMFIKVLEFDQALLKGQFWYQN